MTAQLTKLAQKLLGILEKDRANHLDKIERYFHGDHDDPYMPDGADAEYKLLVKRSVYNLCDLVAATPNQALYVDGFRPGGWKPTPGEPVAIPEEWDHWQYSRMDARQSAIHQSAIVYGHSFTVTERDKKDKIITRGLSPLRTAAVYEDPANDIVPAAALTIKKYPSFDGKGNPVPGVAIMWDDTFRYDVTFEHDDKVTVSKGKRHGASECPVTRFAASVDLEGRTLGVVEPIIPVQDRINQTILDLLVAQSGGAYVTKTITGMAPPLVLNADGTPKLGEDGRPIPAPINMNAKRWLFAEDENVEFGSLPATPLAGYVEAAELAVRQFSSKSQTPPHHLLGQIANLSADALRAAELSLSRKVASFQKAFGESWERVFRIAGELNGNMEIAEDVHGEVLWRDMDATSISATADALVKLKDVGVPVQGLWPRVPGVTQGELDRWAELADSENLAGDLMKSINRATTDTFEPEAS